MVCIMTYIHLQKTLRFAVGGLLIGFAKQNSPKVRTNSESGMIIPFRQGIQGKMNQKTKKRRLVQIQCIKNNPVKSDKTYVQIFKCHFDPFAVE